MVRGPLYPLYLQASMCGGTYGDPSPLPYTGRPGGGGTVERERTGATRSLDLSRDRAAWSRDHSRAERGGDPPRHRLRDTSFIGRELRTLGLVGPMTLPIHVLND